jgi:multiple sugar transport system permease protein
MLLLAAILLFPLAHVVYTSFFRSTSAGELVFIGVGNYAALLQDTRFWRALWTTVLFTVGSVGAHALLGVYVAHVANRAFRGRRLFRLVALSPWMFPSVVVGVTWAWIYQSQYGVLNDALQRLGVIAEALTWLGDERRALAAVVVASIWRGFPFVMLMTLAGLQAIPAEQYEAAAVDGAGTLQRLRFVTLPNLQYILGVALMLDTIWMFRYFDLVQVMTGGGPGSATEVLPVLVYKFAFEYFNFGMAAATAMLMFAVLLVTALGYVRLVLREQRDAA